MRRPIHACFWMDEEAGAFAAKSRFYPESQEHRFSDQTPYVVRFNGPCPDDILALQEDAQNCESVSSGS